MLTGFTSQGIVLFACAAFPKVAKDTTDGPVKATNLGIASSAMLFVFLWIFTMVRLPGCFFVMK
jgi:hypothetical protein